MGHSNIEIKAKCRDHSRVRELLKSNSADYKGTDHQIDTYFKTKSGRLKLREGNIENYLIFYERENTSGPKESKVTLYETRPESNLKEILVNANEILVVVDKKREIYFIENIKFHIDTVDELGSFVEIEAIDEGGAIGLEKLQAQCDKYIKLLGISDNDLLSTSYSDMLLGAK